jgi:type IX secretion system substrate protein/VCBS repeat protein
MAIRKVIFLLFAFCNTGFCQTIDKDFDGRFDYYPSHSYSTISPIFSAASFSFTQFWVSPAGAFGNCWDGAVGYFDNDTLLDVAGYTFSPNKFYVWEQTPSRPDSFALVYEYAKQESGGFGPIGYGDLDGDGKIEFFLGDFSTFTRIYIFSNTGNNTYLSREVQNSLIHTNDGLSSQALLFGDLNKNGQKEIISVRGSSSPTSGMVRIWEHTGGIGSFTFNNLFTYTTVSYVFGKSGIGDSDGDGWDEVFITYGGFDQSNTNIRKIEFDSLSGTFQHQLFLSTAIGLPVSYKIANMNSDSTKELVSTQSSNGRAAVYIFRSIGQNQYQTIDSIFENNDPNTMMISDIKLLTGQIYPAIVAGSFSSKIYVYQYNGSGFVKQYENLTFPGPAIRRVYWLPWTGYDGFFNTWSSSSSNGNFYLFKKDNSTGIISNENLPEEFKLHQNYPNPFNISSKFKVQISKLRTIKIAMFDILGKSVLTLFNHELGPGTYEFEFDGEDLPSGIYFYRLETQDFSDTKKLILLK